MNNGILIFMNSSPYYKIFLTLLIITITSSLVMLSFSPKAYAVWGIGDVSTDAGVTGTTGATAGTTGATAGTTAADLAKEFALDVVAYTVAQELANYLVSKFTTWVNNGFNGNPFYVPDQASFMKEFQDTEILKLYSKVGGSGFTGDKNVILSILDSDKKSIEERLNPTMTENGRSNFSGNFAMGGWDAWEKLGQPENNPIGREVIIRNEYYKKVSEAQATARQELAQGDGYLPKKECLSEDSNFSFGNTTSGSGGGNASNTLMGPPESTITDATGDIIDEDEEYVLGDEEYQALLDESSALGDQAFDQNANESYGESLGGAFRVELQNFTYDPSCERWSTQTPGKLISSSINRASDQQFEGLSRADEFSEIASAALGAMVDAMMNKGLSELKSSADSAFSSSSRDSLSGIQYLGSEGGQYSSPDGQVDWLNTQKMAVDLEIELPRAIANAGIALYNQEKEVAAREQFLPTIQDLDYLLAGPDVGWEDRLKEHFTQATKNETTYLVQQECTSDACKNRQSRFDRLKQKFLIAITTTKSLIADPRYYVYPISRQSRILDHINQIADYGRVYKTAKESLAETRNIYYRLLGIKNEIMGTSYSDGSYNEALDQWVGDTWINPTEWDTWRNEGIGPDGQIELDSSGNPVEAVQTRENLRRQFIALQQDVPQANILSRIKNGRTSAEQTLADMRDLLLFSEQFWADNYRISPNGTSEDFLYWKNLYSWFTNFDSDSSSNSRLGNIFRKTSYPGPGPGAQQALIPLANDYGGPWRWAHPDQLPVNWYEQTNYPGFQNNGSLAPYVGNFDGTTSVVDKLREIEPTNFEDTGEIALPPISARFNGYKVKAYSIETHVIPQMRTPDAVVAAPWNTLRRDREQRLYCGFAFWPEDELSDNGDHSNKRYNAIFCSDGWYRADYIDYLKEYDFEFASSLAGASGF